MRTVPLLLTASLLITIVSPLLAACNLPASKPTTDLNAISTAAAQTLQANAATLTASAQPSSTATEALLVSTPPLVPTATFEILIPTETPLPPPSNPTITANVDTNCRLGPSIDYPRVGFILPGQESIVVGRNDSNTWWYIENPRKPGEYCWVWGETTVVTGATNLLPVITPPPPPTPLPIGVSFQAYFWDIKNCGGDPTAIFQITNDGSETLTSMVLTIRDLSLSITLFGPDLENLPFMNSPACPPGNSALAPGEDKYIGGEVGWLVFPGDDGRAIIELCSEANATGECLEIKINFIFP